MVDETKNVGENNVFQTDLQMNEEEFKKTAEQLDEGHDDKDYAPPDSKFIEDIMTKA